MAQIDLQQTAAGSVLAPSSGYDAFAVDSSHIPYLVGSDGAARPVTNAYVSTTLANASITQSELVVCQLQVPANVLKVGSTFDVKVYATASAANAITWRIRFGTAGTTSDTLISPAIANTPSGTTVLAFLDAQAVCKTTTAWVANGHAAAGTALDTTIPQTSNVTASNVNVANYLSVTGVLATSGTLTIASASVELIKV